MDSIIFYIGENVSLSDKFDKTSDGTIIDIVYPSGSETKKYSQEVVVQITSPNHTITDSIILSKRVTKGSHYKVDTITYLKFLQEFKTLILLLMKRDFYVTSTGLPNYQIFASDTRNH